MEGPWRKHNGNLEMPIQIGREEEDAVFRRKAEGARGRTSSSRLVRQSQKDAVKKGVHLFRENEDSSLDHTSQPDDEGNDAVAVRTVKMYFCVLRTTVCTVL